MRRGLPFQGDAFVAAWRATRGLTIGTETWLLASDDGSAAIPIEIARRGLARIGFFPGETHANANGWRLVPGATIPRLSRQNIGAAARRSGIRIDALDLRRIADANWLDADFAVSQAFEERFAISLEGGLDGVLARGNGKRKRKKFRAQQRHFGERGGYRFLDIPRQDRSAALEVFLAQKRQRFQTMGLPDPFAEPGIRPFLIALYGDPTADTRLYVIESGGLPKAMLGGIVEGDTFWGMFSSYADDADAVASPGELLLWHLVASLAEEGLEALDLGPGAERYKQAWCDRVVPQVDALLALTLRGRLYVAGARLAATARNAIKRRAGVLSMVQRLRRALRTA